MQKLILVYVGVKTKVDRNLLTDDISNILHKEKGNQFCVAIAQSLKSLVKRGLILRNGRSGRYIRLSRDGRETAREIVDYIKSEYGDINWDIVENHFNQKA